MRKLPILALTLVAASCCGQSTPMQHKFWDKPNLALFTAASASRAIDYHSTYYALNRGAMERDMPYALVHSRPAFAAFSVATVSANIGAAYLLHRLNHHRLERAVSVIHVGLVLPSAIRNYSRKQVITWTYPPNPQP